MQTDQNPFAASSVFGSMWMRVPKRAAGDDDEIWNRVKRFSIKNRRKLDFALAQKLRGYEVIWAAQRTLSCSEWQLSKWPQPYEYNFTSVHITSLSLFRPIVPWPAPKSSTINLFAMAKFDFAHFPLGSSEKYRRTTHQTNEISKKCKTQTCMYALCLQCRGMMYAARRRLVCGRWRARSCAVVKSSEEF